MRSPDEQDRINAELLEAVEDDNLDAVLELIPHATNLMVDPAAPRETPLILAAAESHGEIAAALLPFSRWDDASPLDTADNMDRAVERRESIEALPGSGPFLAPKPPVRDRKHRGALDWALFHGDPVLSRLIVDEIPAGHFHRPENAALASELLWAAVVGPWNEAECLRMIFDLIDFKNAPVDVNLAFREAARLQKADLLLMLLPHADPRAIAIHGDTALTLACASGAYGTEENDGRCARALLPVSDLDARTANGTTAWDIALSHQSWAALDALSVALLSRSQPDALNTETLKVYRALRQHRESLPQSNAWSEAQILTRVVEQAGPAEQAAKREETPATDGAASLPALAGSQNSTPKRL